MNVKELIEYLQTQPQDIPVVIDDSLLEYDNFRIKLMSTEIRNPWKVFVDEDDGYPHLRVRQDWD